MQKPELFSQNRYDFSRGRARQTVTLPCFRVRNNSIIMPAFGSFTGSHTLPDTPGARFYMITSGSVISKEQ